MFQLPIVEGGELPAPGLARRANPKQHNPHFCSSCHPEVQAICGANCPGHGASEVTAEMGNKTKTQEFNNLSFSHFT